MKIIIIEDEKPAARLLQRKIEKLGYGITTLLHSVEESLEWFQNNDHPDLIFLDIQLSDGLSFEIFEKIDIKSAVIFTTAYDEYALRAFKLNSIDYLLKPIDEEELATAISKFANQFQVNSVSNLDFDAIKRMLVNPISSNSILACPDRAPLRHTTTISSYSRNSSALVSIVSNGMCTEHGA
jgi:two-component SAPR family response regulator